MRILSETAAGRLIRHWEEKSALLHGTVKLITPKQRKDRKSWLHSQVKLISININ